MQEARTNAGNGRVDFPQLRQQRGGTERGKSVAAFEMNQLHEMGTPSRRLGTAQNADKMMILARPPREHLKVTQLMRYFTPNGIKQKVRRLGTYHGLIGDVW